MKKCGTYTSYKHHGCRCEPCTEAQREYARNRNRMLAYGQWSPYVDADPVRAHVEELRAGGLGIRRVAALAGVNESILWKLVYGDRQRGMKPSRRVRESTAENILAVRASLDVLSPAAKVDATGTRRRLQALVAVGWSQSKLAARLGMGRSNFGCLLERAQVMAATARAVRALYDELWATAPPEAEWRDRAAASRARNYAALRGWARPLAWDDDEIDNPEAEPAEAADVEKRRGRALPEDSELLWLMAQGESYESIAVRFGVSVTTARNTVRRARKALQETP